MVLSRCTGKPSGLISEVIKTHGPPGRAHLPSTQSPGLLEPGKGTKRAALPGMCPCGVPGNLNSLDLEVHKFQGPLWTVSLQAPWSLSSIDPGSTHHFELGQTQCGPYTVSTPHTCQWYLFAVSLPPHNTIEQESLNKWPPLPPCVRVEIKHWRDLQIEEAKINREEGTTLEVTGSID